MQEGSFVVFLKNKLQRFKGQTVSRASSKAETDFSAIDFIKIIDLDSFGNLMLLVFNDFFLSIDFGNSGSMLVNKTKKIAADFSLHFPHSEINFYSCETEMHQGKPNDYFQFPTDILNKKFDGELALSKLQQHFAEENIGNALMEKSVFVGMGDLIRTEALYRAKIHPESLVNNIPEKKLIFLIISAVNFADELVEHFKNDEVNSKALIFEKKMCPKDKTEIQVDISTETNGKIYICPKCQKFYK